MSGDPAAAPIEDRGGAPAASSKWGTVLDEGHEAAVKFPGSFEKVVEE